MKKFLFLTAIASMTLVSCVNDEPANNQNQTKQKITFETPVLYSAANSRATELDGTYPTDEKFVIYAISYQNDFTSWTNGALAPFNNGVVEYDSEIGGWAPKDENGGYYFWENEKMAFAAYSPADLKQTNWGNNNNCSYGANGLTIENYEVLANPGEQYDLLFSERKHFTKNILVGSDPSYNGVTFLFQHALSAIRFKFENDSEEDVKLVSLKVNNVNYKGTFNENITENGEEYDRESNVAPEWTVDNATTDYVAYNSTAIAFPTKAAEIDGVNSFLLMPQTLSDNATLTIVYTVNDVEKTKTVKLNELKSVTADATIPVTSWEMSNRYNYVFHYAQKNKIYFTPTVEGWNDIDNITINL